MPPSSARPEDSRADTDLTNPADAPNPADATDSVRLAWPSEAGAIAALQRRGWAASLSTAVSRSLLAEVDEQEMRTAWAAVITRPPNARQRVLVALQGARLVGFATVVPGQDADADPAVDGEVDEFWIDPPAQRRGHGSRLLNACADTLRADGFVSARWWLAGDDDARRRFLAAAGWAPDGGRREIGSPDGTVRLRQVRLHVSLSDDPAG